MAENVEKKILIDVTVVDNYISAKKNLNEWRNKLKEAEKDQSATAEQLREIAQGLAKANVEYRDAKKEMESAAKSQDLLNGVQDKTVKTLGEMQRELTALKNTPFTGMDEKQVQHVKQQIADLTADIQDYKNEIKGLDTGEIFTNTAEGLEFIAASVSGITNTLNALGANSEVLEGLRGKTVELIAIVQSLGVVTEYLEKKKYNLIVANLKNIATMVSEKTVTAASSVAMLLLGKSTDTTSKSFKLLRGAIIGTGIGALIVVVGELISHWGDLTKWFTKSSEGLTGFGKAFDKVKEIAMGVWNVIQNYVLGPFKAIQKLLSGDVKGALQEVANQYNVIGNYQKGATEQMAKNHEAAMQRMIESERKVKSETLLAESDKLSRKLEVDRAMGASAESLYKEEMEILDKKINGYRYALSTIKNINSDEYKDTLQKLEEAEQDRKVRQAAETKRLADEGKQRAQKAQDEYLNSLELEKTYNIARLKAESKYQSDDFNVKQDYARKEFDLNEQAEKQKLDAQRRFGKISATEYEKQLQILSLKRKEFDNSQAKEYSSYIREQMDEINSLLEKDTDAQIKDVREKYAKAIKELGEMKAPVKIGGMSDEEYNNEYRKYEDFVLKKAYLENQLEKQQAAEIEAIKKENIERQKTNIEKAITEQYAGDLAKYTDNERKKAETEKKMLEESIQRKKAAGIDASEDEASLRETKNKLDQMDLNMQLIDADNNAKMKYEARKSYLMKELEIYKDNADRVKEINADLRENERTYNEERMAELQQWSDMTMNALQGMNDLMSALSERELQEYEQNNAEKKDVLQQRLNAGIISEREYNESVAKLDSDLEKKKADIERKQAIREKAIKTFEIIINTASAIMKAAPNIPLQIATAALGALQLTTVAATPLPKAKKGMLITGASHEEGGVLIEAEGGESIINKKSTSMYAPLLSAINEAGGGVPFVPNRNRTYMADGGYISRQLISEQNKITLKDLEEAMTKAVDKIKIYATIEDIRKANKNYTKIEQRANY